MPNGQTDGIVTIYDESLEERKLSQSKAIADAAVAAGA